MKITNKIVMLDSPSNMHWTGWFQNDTPNAIDNRAAMNQLNEFVMGYHRKLRFNEEYTIKW